MYNINVTGVKQFHQKTSSHEVNGLFVSVSKWACFQAIQFVYQKLIIIISCNIGQHFLATNSRVTSADAVRPTLLKKKLHSRPYNTMIWRFGFIPQ